ncbi:NAD(P)-binding domain-containing protein [Microbulbifer epialgicus]|uniref:NAD(P)-binding domain-containing protein n=1 Tax=Microbulbifer epialgicus TaxID=393907 RepID=A0ABV4P0Q5_9GAMM
MTLRIGVIGSGGFGRAIAAASARNQHDVVLYSRNPHSLPEPIVATTDLADLRDRELVFIATPSQYAEDIATALGDHVDGRHLIVHVSRGLVGEELKLITTILPERTAARRLGALAGPLVADALAEGAIIGTAFPEVSAAVREAIGGDALRIYETRDVAGVQLASATVGLFTILLGFVTEQGTDPGTIAMLAIRGMVEVSRIGETFGAKRETFLGLAGLGDLIAAVAGDQRPEYRLGQAIARGADLTRATAEVGANVEGIQVARNLIAHAQALGVATSIFVSVLDGEMTAEDALDALMNRPVGME